MATNKQGGKNSASKRTATVSKATAKQQTATPSKPAVSSKPAGRK